MGLGFPRFQNTGNGYISTHPELIPKLVLNAENYFMLICHVILFDNCRVKKLPLIFKGSTKSIGLTNVKVNILLDNALQHFLYGLQKNFYFLLKRLFDAGTGMGWGYLNPSRTGMWFNFSSSLGMGRVAGKYMRIGYEDGECKIHPHPAPLPCLFL